MKQKEHMQLNGAICAECGQIKDCIEIAQTYIFICFDCLESLSTELKNKTSEQESAT